MDTYIKPQTRIGIDELTSDEVKLSAPKIMQYLKEGHKSEEPELVIIMGPVAAGKTSYIKKHYANGFVWIDMARIFFDLQKDTGIKLNRKNEIINFIGIVTLELAILEKRNIVVEMIGEDLEKIEGVIDAMKMQGYNTKITIKNSVDDSCFGGENSESKPAEYMSAFYTESFHIDWFEKTAA